MARKQIKLNQIDNLQENLDSKVSSDNLKTINGNSLVGSGNLVISGGGSSLIVKDEGTNLTTTASSINFTGTGVTATTTGSDVKVDIPIPTSFPAHNITIGTNQIKVGCGPVADYRYTNVCLGYEAVNGPTIGSGMVAVGYQALYSHNASWAGQNTAVGGGACYSNTNGNQNTGIGNNALRNNASGTNNVAVGYGAGQYVPTASNNTFIGAATGTSSSVAYNNITCIGYQAIVTGADQIQLGNSTTTTYVYGTVQNRSDLRDKAEVRDTIYGLDFILSLRPVDFKWNLREDYKVRSFIDKEIEKTLEDGTIVKEVIQELIETEIPNDGSKTRFRFHHGFIAQDLENKEFGGFQDHSIKGGQDVMSLGYDEFIAPLVKAIQEQQELINSLKQEIEILKSKE